MPALEKVAEPELPGVTVPVEKPLPAASWSSSPVFVQVTVSPTLIVTVAGENA